MKTNYKAAILFFLLIGTSACGTNAPEGTLAELQEVPNEYVEDPFSVVAFTEKETYSKPVDEVVLQIQNSGTETVYAEITYYLEQLYEGSWYRFPHFDPEIVNDILLIADPNDPLEQAIPLYELESPLSPGTYRIVKPLDVGNSEDVLVAAEFVIE